VRRRHLAGQQQVKLAYSVETEREDPVGVGNSTHARNLVVNGSDEVGWAGQRSRRPQQMNGNFWLFRRLGIYTGFFLGTKVSEQNLKPGGQRIW
jgi:hypothetical protein